MPVVNLNATYSWAQLNPNSAAAVILMLLLGFWIVYRIAKKPPYNHPKNQKIVKFVGYGTMLVASIWLTWGMFTPQPSVASQMSSVAQRYQDILENGIEMAMLNENLNPAPGDRITFMETKGEKCSYFGIVQPGGYVAINLRRCPDDTQTLLTMKVPLNKGPLGTSGQKYFKAFPVNEPTSSEAQ